jgi:putative FmdB family regulatory protein
MPTYDYKCDACGHQFERFQSITAAPIRKCPSCGKSKVRRLIGPGAGLIFKGSGFYITDYGKDGKGPRKADSDKPAAEAKTESAPKSDSPADSKPAPSKPESTKAKKAASE